MTNSDLSPEELRTLASFQSSPVSDHVDPLHFAKLLSMALVMQREGGPELTASGLGRLNSDEDHI